jgi:hypothetical protein
MNQYGDLSDADWIRVFALVPLPICFILGIFNIHIGVVSATKLAVSLGIMSGIFQWFIWVDPQCSLFIYSGVFYPAVCYYCTKLGQ